MDGNRVNKAEVIRYAVEALGVLPLEAGPEIIMVGDRRHDVEGAHENGIRCAGVLYGYGDEDEMRECGADFIIEGVKDLRDFLVKATDGDETV